MKILNLRTLVGPNIFHHKPVIVLSIDLEKLADTSSLQIPGFNTRLQHLLPGIKQHCCSPGYPGGFVERLQNGTYMAHIIEHIALELSVGADIPVTFGKTTYGGQHGIYQIAVRFSNEAGMAYLLEQAFFICERLIADEIINIDEIIYQAKKLVHDTELGPSTKAIIDAALKQNIPCKRLNNQNLVQLGYGRNLKFIQATTTSNTSDIAVDIAQDKELTKKILRSGLIPVPKGSVAHNIAEAETLFKKIDHAVTVKPIDGNHGRGVTLNIITFDEFQIAIKAAFEHSEKIIIEEYIKGNDYRLLIVGGKLIAASHRIPAHIIGDGKHTIAELVDIENANPLRGEDHSKALSKLTIDQTTLNLWQRRNIKINCVPLQNQIIRLRETANLSTGGSAIDVTDDVHQEIQIMCERAARLIGLDVCGVDLIAEDIFKPLSEQELSIIEINAGPGIRMHHYPNLGKARDAGKAIIEKMYPKLQTGRIPIVAITGTNGKTTLTRLISHVLSQAETFLNIGMTSSDGIFINDKKIASGDTTGPASAMAILSDPAIDIAVLETARGGLVRRGLAFDLCDIGIVTNIQGDHIGQDGIENLDDLLKIKSVVIDSVKVGGTVILNEDDPILVKYAKNNKGLKDKKMVMLSLSKVPEPLKKLAFTFGGTSHFHIMNAYMAYEACRALNIPHEKIMKGLESFDHHKNNLGRTNFYKVKNGYVLLDYGHNPHALQSIGIMIAQWKVSKVTGVIAAPGDRSNTMITEIGNVAAEVFNKIIIRDDKDLRGRKHGEIPALLMEAIKNKNKDVEVKIELGSIKALEIALSEMIDGEVVVYFYDELKPLLQFLNQQKIVEASWAELSL